jgi:hypothetical protein
MTQGTNTLTRAGMQVVTGGVKFAGGFVGGLVSLATDPVSALKGIGTMAEHIPPAMLLSSVGGPFAGQLLNKLGVPMVNPLKAMHGAYDVVVNGEDYNTRMRDRVFDPKKSMAEDIKMGKALGSGLIEPMQKSWEQGKYVEAVTQGGLEIASWFVGAGEAKAGSKLGEAGKLVSEAEKAGTIGNKVADTSKATKIAEGVKGAEVAKGGEVVAETANTAGKAKAGEAAADASKAGKVKAADRIPSAADAAKSSKYDPMFEHTPETLQQRAAELAEIFSGGKGQKPIGIKVDPKGLEGGSILLPKNKLGIVQKVEIEVGPKIREADLIAHYEKAAYAQKYVGIWGKTRALNKQLKNWIARNGEPAPLSMAWEAKHDIQKLDSIRAARLEALQSGKLDPKKAEALQHELYELNHQLAEQQATLARMDRSPGFGKIEARIKTNIQDFKAQNPDVFKHTDDLAKLLGVSKGKLKQMGKDAPAMLEKEFFDRYYPSKAKNGEGFQLSHMPLKPEGKSLELSKEGKIVESLEKVKQVERFEKGATAATVYEKLLGKSSTSSMKAYADMLIKEKIGGITSYKDLEGHIKNIEKTFKEGFEGRSVDEVRHSLKENFRQQVMDKMTAQGLTDAQKHQKLLKMTERLNGSDKGSLAEEWYRLVHDKDGVPQVSANKADLKRQGISLEGDRRMDLVNGSTMREIKAISGKMGDHDLSQFKDFMELTQKRGQVSKGDKAFTIENARYVFTDPKGVRANAEWMVKQLDDPTIGDKLSFEVFNQAGEKMVVNQKNAEKWLENLPTWL